MPQIINTNIASLNAQRNLNTSQTSLATALQRLSSGLRINSAKDDAAGMAISERMTTQIRGLNQAVRNANDGISLAQTAEGAMAEMTANLQRIRELAIQAANATNSASDRAALDQEVQQRLSEVDRIAAQTSFNGQKILDGSFGGATFQVGANAGETIGINLNTSMRTNAFGQVALATSDILGGTASGGTHSVTVSNLDFSQAYMPATSGRVTVSLDRVNFGTPTAAGSAGSIQFTLAATDFRSGFNTQGPITDFDYSGGPLNVAQFDVKVGTTIVGITLNAPYGDADGVAAAIQSQIQAVPSLANVTVANSGGTLTFTNVGSNVAVEITNADTNAGLAGFANSLGTTTTGPANATFSVDGKVVTLNQNYGSAAAVAAGITSQLQADLSYASYAATNSGNQITIVNDNAAPFAASGPVVISAANTAANAGGIYDGTGTAGTATTAANNGGFQIENGATDIDIVLNQDYGSYSAVQTAIQNQLNAQASGQFTVSIDSGGSMTISRTSTGASSLGVVINSEVDNDADLSTINGGLDAEVAPIVPGTPGADAIPTTNATFLVDGKEIVLNQLYTISTLASAIGTQLGTGYTVSGTGSSVTITNNEPGSAAVTISNADPAAYNAGFVNGSGTAGTVEGEIELTEFSIAVGDGEAKTMSGTYASAQALAEAINREMSGIFAMASSDGRLELSATETIKLSGSDVATLGFDQEYAVEDGNLTQVSVLTAGVASASIMRIDSALTMVSSLRSTFGAIQNRFESTILNLQTTSENLSASRSRIMDADFAAETAALTRAQILQQAGVAMLAQANALPNNVLTLLRG